jgi:Rad3-related DNA helicase
LRKEQGKGRWKGRAILAYTNAQERDAAVEAFNRSGGVLLAPSLDRGLDLPDDLCRVVVVAKVPFPALGDRQVSERLRRPGGQMWYGVQVARSLVQMTGRGVRHEEDWATTFILDKQFVKYYRSTGRKLLPDWWIEALTSDKAMKNDRRSAQ